MPGCDYNRGIVTVGLDRLIDAVQNMGVGYTTGHGFGWEISKLREYHEALFDMCPVQPGQVVALTETREIEISSGWYPYRESFVKGATATVEWIDWSGGRFHAAVMFDRQVISPDRYGCGKGLLTGEDNPDRRSLFCTPAEWWTPQEDRNDD